MEFPEFQRFRPSFSYPRGMVQTMLQDQIKIDRPSWRYPHSYHYYAEVQPTQTTAIEVVKKVKEGYFWHFDGLRVTWPPKANGDPSPIPVIQLKWGVRHRDLSDVAVDMEVKTTPAARQELRYFINDNCTLFFSDFVKATIRGQDGTDPSYVRIAFMGTNIPREVHTV